MPTFYYFYPTNKQEKKEMATPKNPFYDLSPEIRSLLAIETFRVNYLIYLLYRLDRVFILNLQENVSTTDFIERISAGVIDQMKGTNGNSIYYLDFYECNRRH